MENYQDKEALKANRRYLFRTNPLWIIFVFLMWMMFIAAFLRLPYEYMLMLMAGKLSDGMMFTLEMYTGTICDILTLLLLTWCIEKNRYIWKSFLFPKKYEDGLLSPEDRAAEFYGRSRNGIGQLWIGIALGFVTNFFCIACALLHGDIKLYFDASVKDLPLLLFALVSVCIQSTSEELWCRGFLYERLHERFPLWLSILVNGVLFGLLHMFNPGVTVLSIISIAVCGISYSLLRWYSGNIWIAMGIHAGWNFTQNYLFGLPNSGLVSQVSVFHLDAANGISNLIYDFGFGVEGALPAIFTDAMVGIVCLILAKKAGRLRELGVSRKKAEEMQSAGQGCITN